MLTECRLRGYGIRDGYRKDTLATRVDNHIRHLRKQIGWTIEEMALVLGVHKTTLSKWERGAETPDIWKKRIVELLNKHHVLNLEVAQVWRFETAREAKAA